MIKESSGGVESRICKVCNSKKLQLYCKKNGLQVIKCCNCNCGFLDLTGISLEPSFFYQQYYAENNGVRRSFGYDNYYALEKSLRLNFRRRIKVINKYLDNTGKKTLLDIGCGPGFFLQVAEKYFDSYGVEVSQQAADYAKKNLHLKVINSIFYSGLFENTKFDVVTLWDTLEHIDSPQQTLRNIAAILKKNGLLVFTTGDFGSLLARFFGKKWHLLTLPEHLFFFSKKGIDILLNESGFKIVKLGYPYAYYTLDYILERIIKSFDLPSAVLPLYFKHILNNLILPFNLFDIMLVISKRRQ